MVSSFHKYRINYLAAYFAEKIFDKHVLNALKSKGKEDKLKVAVLRLKVLRTAVGRLLDSRFKLRSNV